MVRTIRPNMEVVIMVCPTCGASFSGVGSFCPQCGSRLPVPPASPADVPPSPGYAQTPPPAYGQPGYPPPGYVPSGYSAPPFAPAFLRVQRNLQIMAILWGCFAVYRVLAGLAGMFFLRALSHGGLFGHSFPFDFDNGHSSFFSALVPFTLVTTLALAGLSALVGFGLLQRRPWGRTFAIVISIISLLKFPLGTALGIYTLWVLAPAASAMEYDSIADRTRPGF